MTLGRSSQHSGALVAITAALLLAGCSSLAPAPGGSAGRLPGSGTSSGPSATSSTVSPTLILQPGATLASPAPTPLPPGPNVQAAGLLSPTVGWALVTAGPSSDPNGSSTLYSTADAGTTWRSAPVPGPTTGRGILGIAFATASDGWLATLGSTDPRSTTFDVWRTTDGGRTWQNASVPEGANRSTTMGNVVFSILDPEHLFLLVEGGMADGWVSDLYASADGGRTWSPDRVTGPNGVTGALSFADEADGVIAGGAPGNRLFATADAGRSWERVAYPVPSGADPAFTTFRSAPRFFDATAGALVATYGNSEGPTSLGVLVTHDAGAGWSLASSVPETSTNDVPVAFLSRTQWVAVLGDALLTTSDAGATWTRRPTVGLPAGPQSIQFTDAQHAWALVPMSVCLGFKTDCSNGVGLYATADGGAIWNALWPGRGPSA